LMRYTTGRGKYGIEKKPKKPINRRKIVGLVIVIIVASGLLFVYNYGLPSTSFHSELWYPQQISKSSVFFSISLLYDCTLNISFVDEEDLVYRMDIRLSEPAFASDAFVLTVSHSWARGYGSVSVSFKGAIIRTTATPVLVEEVQLVLGSATPYDILISGSNVNSSITFGNNMTASESSLFYSATGSNLNISFTEDMVFGSSGMEVRVSEDLPDYVNLFADLPSGVNGTLSTTSVLERVLVNGWTYRPDPYPPYVTTYSTNSLNPEPLLSLQVDAVYRVRAWLVD